MAFGSVSPVALICTSREHRNRYRVHSPFPALHRLIPTASWCCEELRAPLQPAVLSPEASDQSPCSESHLGEGGAAASCAWLRAEGHAAAPLLHAHKQHLQESTKKTCSGTSCVRQGHEPQPGQIQPPVSERLVGSVGSQQRGKSLSLTGSRDNTEMPGQCSEMLKETLFATQEPEMCTDIIKKTPSKGSLHEADTELS